MNAKHQFKYTFNETDLEEYSPHEITFEMPGEATLDQILYNFQTYLKAVGFVFDGELQIVDDTCDEACDCMADFDKDVVDDEDEFNIQKLKEWNEGLKKLEEDLRNNK